MIFNRAYQNFPCTSWNFKLVKFLCLIDPQTIFDKELFNILTPSPPTTQFCVFERWWFPKGTPLVTFRRKIPKNRVRHVFRLIFGWKSRIRWDKFNISILGGSNLAILIKISPFWPKIPNLTHLELEYWIYLNGFVIFSRKLAGIHV